MPPLAGKGLAEQRSATHVRGKEATCRSRQLVNAARRTLAKPKSPSLTYPLASMKTFSGCSKPGVQHFQGLGRRAKADHALTNHSSFKRTIHTAKRAVRPSMPGSF